MSGLVERLREAAARLLDGNHARRSRGKLYREAAEEIERLRNAARRIVDLDASSWGPHPLSGAEFQVQMEEAIDALAEALGSKDAPVA